ncbi:MAG: hypothetical protein B7X41_04555, partial [Microbacterium sp. 14-71-5]
MRLFSVGSTAGSAIGHAAPAATGAPALVTPHPSAPIPVVGPGIGAGLRVPLAETGIRTFPLILGGAEFGWNTDADTALHILDRYAD